MVLYDVLNILFRFLDSFAFIVLAALGLVIIFGMMGIINLAHGEFILVGAYATTLSYGIGLPLALAMVVGVVVPIIFGAILEVTIIHRLYNRLLDSMVATWALGIILIQLTRIAFGNQISQIGTPLGSISYGPYSYSAYRVLLAFVSIAVLVGVYLLFTKTEFGLKARATMQDAETASAMGIDTRRVYFVTFSFGSGLAGLAGALYAPTLAMTPELGAGFLLEAFVAVIVGGSSVILGTSLAGLFLGFINGVFSQAINSFAGQIALLIAALIVIRLMPDGITGWIESWRQKRHEGQK